MILPALLLFLCGLLLSAGAIVGAVVIAHSPSAFLALVDTVRRGVGRLRKDAAGLSARRLGPGSPLSERNIWKLQRILK